MKTKQKQQQRKSVILNLFMCLDHKGQKKQQQQWHHNNTISENRITLCNGTSPVPHHQDQTSLATPPPASAVPTVNSLASSPPERSTEAVPFYPAPSGTGTHSPLIQWRRQLLTLVCQVSPTDQSTSSFWFVLFFSFFFSRERMSE